MRSCGWNFPSRWNLKHGHPTPGMGSQVITPPPCTLIPFGSERPNLVSKCSRICEGFFGGSTMHSGSPWLGWCYVVNRREYALLALVTIPPYWIRSLDLEMKTRQYLLQITMAMQGNAYRPRVKEDLWGSTETDVNSRLLFYSANSRWYHLTLRTISFGTITYCYGRGAVLVIGLSISPSSEVSLSAGCH